jgi:hypothetical protein
MRDPRTGAAVQPARIDGKRALQYLRDLCAIGPRISGSAGMKKQQELLKDHFEANGGKVEFQRFIAEQKSKKPEKVEMANMVVSYWPERTRRMILCAHYDTRPIADQEPDEKQWHLPFVSANDGGSGVAFLMELARHVPDLNINNIGVDFVLFDGEEYIWKEGDKYSFGSEHFVQTRRRGKFQDLGAIWLNMIAGKGAQFAKDPHSLLRAGVLVDSVWRVAGEQKCDAFVHESARLQADDDLLALHRSGTPTIRILAVRYPHWRRLSDTPDKCTAQPLEQVSKVLSVWLQRVK